MENDLNHARISLVIHAAAALAVSYLSAFLGGLYAGLVGIVVLVAIGYPLEKFAGKRGFKWWLANGIFVYLFLWLVGWTYFLNVGI